MIYIVSKEKTIPVLVKIEIIELPKSYIVSVNGRELSHSYSKEFTIEEVLKDVSTYYIRNSDL